MKDSTNSTRMDYFKSNEFIKFLNSYHYIIPLIYKDYGRMRGQIASVIAFERFFEEFHKKESYLGFQCLRVEVSEIKELYKNKLFRDKILFSFNFVQDIEARGMYPLIARKHDICFSKGNVKGKYPYEFVNEYAQTRVYSTNKNMKYFPKYFKFSQKRSTDEIMASFDKLVGKKSDITMGIYYRKDTCPIQAKIYDEVLLKMNGKIKFKLYGLDNDTDLQNEKLDVDVFLYVHPNHKDPFPNIIFDALCNSIPILRILNDKIDNDIVGGSGIEMLAGLFPSMFMHCNINNILSIPLTLHKYRYWGRTNVLEVIEYNNIKSRNLISDTRNAIATHISYVRNDVTRAKANAKINHINIPIVELPKIRGK